MKEVKIKRLQSTLNRIPEIKSCLYDLNLLPECLAACGHGADSKEHFYMLSIVKHFEALEERMKKQ